jgi:metallo-beta-lactamase family protein
VRAQVAALEQFSDHADTPELLEWLHTFPKAPSRTYLVHGEPAAAAALRASMAKELGWRVEVAEFMEKVPAGTGAGA